MITSRILPALALSAVLAAGAAIAQTPERNTLGEAAATAQTQEPIGSGAAAEWVGSRITAMDGTEIGTVSRVIVDDNGFVTEVRARVGGLFGLFTREVSIPIARILLEQSGALVAEMSAEEIRKARPVNG